MSQAIEVTKQQRGFVFDTLDGVKAALSLYELKGSMATQNQLQKDSQDAALAKLMSDALRRSSAFVNRLCKEMTAVLAKANQFNKNFDYDGEGTFFKTTVDVDKLDEPYYWLKFFAAYVGDACEVDLAKALGRERETVNYEVSVELPSNGPEFEFDLREVLAPFYKVFPGCEVSPEKFLEGRPDLRRSDMLMTSPEHFETYFRIDDISEANPASSRGTKVSGYCRKMYSKPGTYYVPKAIFTLCRRRVKKASDGREISWSPTPILNPAALFEMAQLSEQIKLAFMQHNKPGIRAV